MGLRGRTLAIVGLVLTVVFLAALAISARVTVTTDRLAQARTTRERARSAVAELQAEIEEVSRAARGIGDGEAARAVVAGTAPRPSEEVERRIEDLELDVAAIFVGPEARWIDYRPKAGAGGEAPSPLVEALHNAALTPSTDHALFAFEGDPWLAVVAPVTSRGEQSAVTGTLVVARRLDGERLARLGQLFEGQLELVSAAAPALDVSDPLVAGVPLIGESSAGTPWNLVLRRRAPSGERLADELLLLGGDLVAVGLIAGVTVLILLDRMVLRRIAIFSNLTQRIRGGLHPGLRLPVRSNDELDRLAASLNAVLDEVDRTTSQLRHEALHDPLTGMANRTLLFDRIGMALARASRDASPGVALIFLDLDRLKVINDHLGHAAGDFFIAELARRLAAGVRPGDTVARLGGDEFAILLQDIPDPAVAIQRGEALLESVRTPMIFRGTSYNVTASLGLATATRTHDPAQLVREADMAMYEAKAGGRNRLSTYDAVLHGRLAERLAIEQALGAALEAGQVGVALQPIVSATTGALVGFEALARWNHPTLGQVSPSRFIPIAEETALIVTLDRYVLERAVLAASRLRRSGKPILISVNHSGRSIDAPDFVEYVIHVLEKSRLPAEALVIELTETQLAKNEDRWLPRIQTLVDRGVRFALDDFGLGFSSLSRLQHIPVAVLKLDREFVATLDSGQDAVARAILGMAEELGRIVIAEGVETIAQRRRLVELGCPMIQGHLVGLPEAEARQALRLGLRTDGLGDA